MQAPTWTDELELLDGLYARLFWVYHRKAYVASFPEIRLYVANIENRIVFKNNSEYDLELLTPETMK